jgi:hypothetical protein
MKTIDDIINAHAQPHHAEALDADTAAVIAGEPPRKRHPFVSTCDVCECVLTAGALGRVCASCRETAERETAHDELSTRVDAEAGDLDAMITAYGAIDASDMWIDAHAPNVNPTQLLEGGAWFDVGACVDGPGALADVVKLATAVWNARASLIPDQSTDNTVATLDAALRGISLGVINTWTHDNDESETARVADLCDDAQTFAKRMRTITGAIAGWHRTLETTRSRRG